MLLQLRRGAIEDGRPHPAAEWALYPFPCVENFILPLVRMNHDFSIFLPFDAGIRGKACHSFSRERMHDSFLTQVHSQRVLEERDK